MTIPATDFRPDYDQESPGAYLEWILESRGIKKVDFAKRCGRPTKTVSEILSSKASITPETALQFEKVLGVTAAFLLSLQTNYQLQEARESERSKISSDHATTWSKHFPVREMASFGFIDADAIKNDCADTLLRFFGVSSISAWESYWAERMGFARFKQQKHFNVDKYAVAAWLRRGEILATEVETASYDERRFRKSLSKIRSLTERPWSEVVDDLIELCRRSGVAVVLIPNLKRTGLRGAAWWAQKDKAVIMLSDYGKREERVWFAFFHEAAHVLLHSKKSVFIDREDIGNEEAEIEDEANSFSAEYIVSSDVIDEFRQTYGPDANYLPKKIISKYARDIGISAGLLLERLQHEGLVRQNSKLNSTLKRALNFGNG